MKKLLLLMFLIIAVTVNAQTTKPDSSNAAAAYKYKTIKELMIEREQILAMMEKLKAQLYDNINALQSINTAINFLQREDKIENKSKEK